MDLLLPLKTDIKSINLDCCEFIGFNMNCSETELRLISCFCRAAGPPAQRHDASDSLMMMEVEHEGPVNWCDVSSNRHSLACSEQRRHLIPSLVGSIWRFSRCA